MRRSMVLGASVMVFHGLSAQGTTTVPSSASAPISEIRYDVTFNRATGSDRIVHVATSFAADGADPVLLSLPAWTPGAYEISNFARWVTNFMAMAGGRRLSWDKLDYDTWRIR